MTSDKLFDYLGVTLFGWRDKNTHTVIAGAQSPFLYIPLCFSRGTVSDTNDMSG